MPLPFRRTLSPKGRDFIASFEGCVLYVYDDKRVPVHGRYPEWAGESVRGTLTIGYGHTDAGKYPLKLTKGLRISKAQALEILDVDLDECEDAVNTLVDVPLTQGQFDALVSFTFNCGAGNLKKLIVPLNRGDYAATRAKFDLYVSSKGEKMAGLVRRRDGEQALWDARYGDAMPADVPDDVGVHHSDDVAPVPAPADPVDKWIERGTACAPIATAAAGLSFDWKAVLAIGIVAAIAIVGAIVWKRSRQ